MRCDDCESETVRSLLYPWYDGRDLCRRCWLIAEYCDQQPDHSRDTAAATADTIIELETAIEQIGRRVLTAGLGVVGIDRNLERAKLQAFLDGVKYQACLLPCTEWSKYLPRFQQPSHTFKNYEG